MQIVPEAEKSLHARAVDAAANLEKYLVLFFAPADYRSSSVKTRPPVPKGIQDPLSRILAACFPELKREELIHLMNTSMSFGEIEGINKL